MRPINRPSPLRILVLSRQRPRQRRAAMRWVSEVKLISNYRPGMTYDEFHVDQAAEEVKIQLWGGIEHYRKVMETAPSTPEERLIEAAQSGPITLKDARELVPEYGLNSLPVLMSTMARVGMLERCGRGVYRLPENGEQSK